MEWLRTIRILDPACGSGNFLYAAMLHMKKHEHEVVRALADLTGVQELLLEEVHPKQFHGIEVNPWAAELAHVTLWIGYHQFWKEHHGQLNPNEPVIQDTGTIMTGDALLRTSGPSVHIPEKDRLDQEPRIIDPVTGNLIPDPSRKLPYLELQNPQEQVWPKADFIIGNPPYLGGSKLRRGLGDGYTDALNTVYPDRSGQDLVAYWVGKAGREVAAGNTTALGLITTNSIGDPGNRGVLDSVITSGSQITWAVKDHPWVDTGSDAAVRVSMLVFEGGQSSRTPEIGKVIDEKKTTERIEMRPVKKISSLLTVETGASAVAKIGLQGNAGMVFKGIELAGSGFQLSLQQENNLLSASPQSSSYIKKLIGGRDLIHSLPSTSIIDLGELSMEEAEEMCPHVLDHVRRTVKPERDANREKNRKEKWWVWGRERKEYRTAVAPLSRHIARPVVSKHNFFRFVPAGTLVDASCSSIVSDEASILGVLSSRVQKAWAKEVCGSLEGRLRFSGNAALDPFPFPAFTEAQKAHVADLAEKMEVERDRIAAVSGFKSFTAAYNLIAKVSEKEALSPEERGDYQAFGLGVLQNIHRQIDEAVCQAYGFAPTITDQEIVEGVVKLHEERVEEEKRGIIRWMRPDWQTKNPVAEEKVLPEAQAGVAQDAPQEMPGETPRQAGSNGIGPQKEIDFLKDMDESMVSAEQEEVSGPSRFFKPRRRVTKEVTGVTSLTLTAPALQRLGSVYTAPEDIEAISVAEPRVLPLRVPEWPMDPIEQLLAIRTAMSQGAMTVDTIAKVYPTASRATLQQALSRFGNMYTGQGEGGSEQRTTRSLQN